MAGIIGGAAAGIALYDWLGSKGQTLSITDDITTNLTIDATTNVNTECFQSVDASQEIKVTVTDQELYSGKINQSCLMCTSYLNDIYNARIALERKAKDLNPNYTVQEANETLATIMSTGIDGGEGSTTVASLGPCTASCFGAVVFNTSQTSRLSAKQSCTVTNVVTNDVQQTIKGAIQAQLKNQQDIIGQLESAFTSNQESIEDNLSSTLAQNVTNNFTQDLAQSMQAFQFIEVKGNSFLIENVGQTFTGSMVGKMQVNNTVTDQLRQSAGYSIAQSLLNKNDTLGDLSRDFLQVVRSMSDLLEDLTSQILIILGSILGAIALTVGALYIFDKSFRSWTRARLRSYAQGNEQQPK